jgi:hypothetical protein
MDGDLEPPIRNVAREERERKDHQEYIAAISRISDQLATDEQEQSTADKKRRNREWLTIVLLFGTVIAAAIGDRIFYSTMRDSRHTFELGSRAWISPVAAKLLAPIAQGQPVKFGVRYDNVGRLPAFDVRVHYSIDFIPNTTIDDGTAMAAIDKNDICDGVEPSKNAEVVYPNTGGETVMVAVQTVDPKTGQSTNPKVDDFISGHDTMTVQFCAAYRTLEATHKTAFCFLYRTGYSNGNTLSICDKGNHAT